MSKQHTQTYVDVTGRMHQLRRHMALVGHPVLGDPKYTYGYAKRHPDAAVLLDTQEAEQAMTPPFGVSSEHPGHQTARARYACSILTCYCFVQHQLTTD